MDLEGILNEISQTEKDKESTISLVNGIKIKQKNKPSINQNRPIDTDNGVVDTRGKRWRAKCLKGVSFRAMDGN